MVFVGWMRECAGGVWTWRPACEAADEADCHDALDLQEGAGETVSRVVLPEGLPPVGLGPDRTGEL